METPGNSPPQKRNTNRRPESFLYRKTQSRLCLLRDAGWLSLKELEWNTLERRRWLSSEGSVQTFMFWLSSAHYATLQMTSCDARTTRR